jgi:hypothetical protein
MKTITLKADAQFDATLSKLATRLQTTKSAVIREAVGEYNKHLDRKDLAKRIREVALRARESTEQTLADFDGTVADGL